LVLCRRLVELRFAIMAKEITTTQKYLSEGLGTFLLVFSVGLTALVGADDQALKVFGPTAIGCILMVMVYALGDVSGAHLNPAVTFAIFLQKGIGRSDALMYMISQCIGGAVAGLSCGFLYGWEQGGKAQVGPADSEAFMFGAPIVEFLYCFMLCFVVLNVAVAKAQHVDGDASKPIKNNYYGLAIGFVVIAGGIGGGHVSGGCLNPAVAIGVNFMGPSWKSLFAPIYVLCHFLGAFFATTAFHIVRPEERIDETDENYQQLGAMTKFAFKIESLFDPEDTAEFLGTFFLCLTISLNHLAPLPSANGGVWSIAACLMCMIYAMGDISGGLFNPALTLAFTARFYATGQGLEGNIYSQKLADVLMSDENGRSARKEPLKYVFAQLIGGAAGSGMTMLIYLLKIGDKWPAMEIRTGITPAYTELTGNFTYHAAGQYTLGQAFFAEVFGTFILCFVVLAVASRRNPLKDYTAFCIGGCIVGAGYAWGPLSGAVLNPAVTLGSSLCFKLSLIYKAEPFVYILAQFCGGILAAVVFRFAIYTHEFQSPGELEQGLNPRENE